ncbi:hypothetical protein C2857_003714 [Epichloe festucae Fl1]|uniref:ADF-H domain-containing protein n=1 Tax=Epichloe festucae (strain Fl1) TaxID=877507 RepID=A0A7S9KKE6_EPIFF|nr:hypothetical protein C2857_003714 [Epichloe festucae Fl1]
MSLNGLDDPMVVEAHEAATSEPGGWFLLKYEGRDEIQVLSRGNGGIVEVRNAVAEYDETSPLYGFLKYRRRSVLIKYLPEDCSRIIQARVAVHFNAICERFLPYDTVFEITSAGELGDSKLSAACSLHTATCSTSSSTSSLRQRRLMEIAEEEEDEQRATKRQYTHDADESRPQSADDRPSTAELVTLNSDLASSPENSKFAAATTSDVPPFVGVNERPTSPDSDVYTIGAYSYSKPRVKLGPRPSVDANARPQTAGNFRPVSAIPAGFKLFGKGGKKSKGKDGTTGSSPQEEIVGLNFSASDDGQDRPTTSSSSIFDSVPLPAPAQKKPTISPEKARLMKAMQLREKKKKKMSVLPPSDEFLGDDEITNAEDDPTQVLDEAILSSEIDCDKNNQRVSLSKDDSGVVLDTLTPLTHADQTSDLTPSDSHPASPLVGSSEAGHSTKASSISETTDETIHAKEETEPKEVDTPTEDVSKCTGIDVETFVAKENAAEIFHLRAETAIEETNEPITTIAELSTTSNIAEDPQGGSIDDGESFENVALPVSKFSANAVPGSDESVIRVSETDTSKDLDTAYTTTSSPVLKAEVSAQDLLAATKAAGSDVDALPAPSNDVREEASLSRAVAEEKSKRRSQIEPIKTTNLELKKDTENNTQSASLEKAAPVSVTKTPITPSFPQSTMNEQDESPLIHTVRTVSNPVGGNLIVPADANQSSARSMSSGAAYLHLVTQQQQQQQQGGNLAKKSNNIGSSISQRIKALEKLSAASGDAPASPARERPSSTFYAVKKREPSRSPSVMDRANSFRNQAPPPPEQSQEVPAEAVGRNRLERSGSVTSRLSMFESPTASATPRNPGVPSGNNTQARPESVSVMARIIRDPNHTGHMSFEPPRDPSEYNHLELKQSPLLVDHQTAFAAEKDYSGFEHTQDRGNDLYEQSKSSKPRQSSLGIVKGFIKERRKSVASDTGNSPYSSGRAESVHANPAFSPRSSFSKDRETILLPSESAIGDDAKSANGDKKLSRAGRFMRRLSNLSSSRSKNNLPSISATATKEEAHESVQSRPSTTGTPTIVSYMGDVNVQFPDNLLWKRRNMSLDSQGFLILSALPVQNDRPAQGTKRYHLSEFRPPNIPDVEVQELPNSVVLEFIEGSGIQVACEDRTRQLRVLQTLQEAHSTRGTTYGL